MHWIDWLFVAVPIGILLTIVLHSRRYMRSVADFLSGGRLAGRYLLTVSKGEMGAGATVFVANFEVIRQSGFTMTFWTDMTIPVTFLLALSGFVIYRYRETRAMTLAQFFEIRYNKSFRVFTGMLGFLAGIVNFGIIPVVGARFLTYILDLPQTVSFFGRVLPTPILLMAVLLSITLFMTLSGGLISLMIADCVEGIISQVLYLVLIFGLLFLFSWSEVSQVLENRPLGQSYLNPFDSLANEGFNLWYVLMGIFLSIYGTMAWQNQSAFNSAALTAHESRMAGILARWREMGKLAVAPLLAVCAIAFLAHPDFAAQSVSAHAQLAQIDHPQTQSQMTVPVGINHMLPLGLRGALCIILLMGVFGGDGSHLHSWGSLFVQDVLVPLRKKPLTATEHIRWLRLSIIGVAVFAFVFGSLFQQMEFISMWWAVTMAIYVGGAGACIIGGLYWKKGTTAGAWAALLTGSGLSAGGILARQLSDGRFPLNGQQISFGASLLAAAVYIVVSLLTCKKDFDMDRMLHRTGTNADPSNPPARRRLNWARMIGVDDNFSRGDKWIAGSLFTYSVAVFTAFIVICLWNAVSPWPMGWWSTYWHIRGIGLPIFFAVVTAIWFTWGGVHDILKLFERLKREKINPLDNGMVVNNQNLDDIASAKPLPQTTSSTRNQTSGRVIH